VHILYFEKAEFCARPGIKIRFVRDWWVADVWVSIPALAKIPSIASVSTVQLLTQKKESSRGKKTAKKVTLVAVERENTKKTRI
jgi:hypothetical protein